MLRQHSIKRLGVVYKGKLVGIISASDVISVTPDLVDVISEKASLLRGEIGRGGGNISGYCDECGEWSDLLQYEGVASRVECRADVRIDLFAIILVDAMLGNIARKADLWIRYTLFEGYFRYKRISNRLA